ncbi:MAG: hypothetical protein KAX65_15585 [Caldilineaceae bacterium]|nr:hypothetical protein [Caldilineaceae bacterium]
MAEPHSAAGLLGVKYAALMAGFAGGVVSLAFLRELDRAQMVLAVAAGSACAGYLTPLAVPMIARAVGVEPTPEMENAAAFIVGLTAMNIVPGLMHLSDILRRDPAAALRGKDTQP